MAKVNRSLRMMVDTEDPLFYGMKKLKLQGKDLCAVPPELYNLTDLEVLDMSPEREACLYYKLQEIPAGVCKLINLKVIMVDTNDLRSLPPDFGLLQNLERIALSNNCLTNLPAEFIQLKNLKSLHIANNKFEIFPEEVVELENLEFLDLSDNMITNVPKTVRRMKKLETFLLFENKIERLPDEICELVQLRCIWLGNNQISQLPRHFGRLTLLDWSWHYTSTTLNGNPLVHPPLDVCKLGADEISKYFQNLHGGQLDNDEPPRQTLDFNPEAMRYLRRGSAVQAIPDFNIASS